MEEVHYLSRPQLNRPLLLAAWPGVGQVALTVVSYLRRVLGGVEFAQLSSLPYYELSGVIVEANLIQPPRFPQSLFYYWHDPGEKGDLLFFEAEAQPSLHAYELAHRVLEVAQGLGAKRVGTMAAALVSELPKSPQVWLAASTPSLGRQLEALGAVAKGDFYVAGMNGVLLAVAQERGMEAFCLLGETLRLFPQKENPAAALAILEVLAPFLGFDLDLSPLREEAKQAQRELEGLMMQSRSQFIDHFTFPIWEMGEAEDKA